MLNYGGIVIYIAFPIKILKLYFLNGFLNLKSTNDLNS